MQVSLRSLARARSELNRSVTAPVTAVLQRAPVTRVFPVPACVASCLLRCVCATLRLACAQILRSPAVRQLGPSRSWPTAATRLQTREERATPRSSGRPRSAEPPASHRQVEARDGSSSTGEYRGRAARMQGRLRSERICGPHFGTGKNGVFASRQRRTGGIVLRQGKYIGQ